MPRTDDRSPALRAVQALESSALLDPLVGRVRPIVADALDRSPALASLLHGAPLGHCLLYTSPSPRDRQKSRMPSSA